MFNGKTVLVTGGTGSFGRKFISMVLGSYNPKKLIVFSRDEFKQFEMAKVFNPDSMPIRYFLGDIRDRERLYRAFDGVDIVIHAAALKQVPALEYNPFEAVKTNIIGAQNIADAAVDRMVEKVVALSTDKAVNPANLYGSTKLSMEKIFVAANAYSGAHQTRFMVVRYGNVVGSRGSVIPLFSELIKKGVGELPVTDERMTRFWITLAESVELVFEAVRESVGGEIFIPRIPSMKVVDLVSAMSPGGGYRVIGIRPGEKLHETLISEDESRTTVVKGRNFIVLPQNNFEHIRSQAMYRDCEMVTEGFVYRSDTNTQWMGSDEIGAMIEGVELE